MMTNLCSNYFLRLHFFGFLCKPKPFSGNKQRLASGGCQHSTSFLSALPATPHHTPCWHRFLRVVLYWFSHCYSCAADDDGADLLLVRLMFRLLKVVPWWLLRVGGWAGCHRGPRRSTSWSSHLPGQLSRGNQTSPNAATFWLNNTNREHFSNSAAASSKVGPSAKCSSFGFDGTFEVLVVRVGKRLAAIVG